MIFSLQLNRQSAVFLCLEEVMKQTAEHKITVRIKTRFPREDWPVLIKAMLDEHSIEDDYRIVFVEKTNITANFQGD